MTVTVIVCTRNRPNMISECLTALSANEYPDMETIVVDQSTDSATADAVGRALRSDNRIRYIHTNSIGLSRARNMGIQESRGEIIGFTDDDCTPDQGWVKAIVDEFSNNPDVSAVYGRCLPSGDFRPKDRLVGVKVDSKQRFFCGRCNPWRLGHGNNMAFRRCLFKVVGFFDEALGPGGLLWNADDADLTYRVLCAGFKAMYSPKPVIYHKQFRHGAARWQLEKEYGMGSGAMLCKYLRCGDAYMLFLLGDRLGRGGLKHIMYGILTMQSAHIRMGWYRIVSTLLGMYAARGVPVDTFRRVFTVSPSGERVHA